MIPISYGSILIFFLGPARGQVLVMGCDSSKSAGFPLEILVGKALLEKSVLLDPALGASLRPVNGYACGPSLHRPVLNLKFRQLFTTSSGFMLHCYTELSIRHVTLISPQ